VDVVVVVWSVVAVVTGFFMVLEVVEAILLTVSRVEALTSSPGSEKLRQPENSKTDVNKHMLVLQPPFIPFIYDTG
jgi:hypothetical protein